MAGFGFFAFFAFSQLLIAHSQWTHESFDKDKFKVSWKYDKPTDILLFKVDVQATGWVGFGFTLTPKGMKDYDVVVGGKASDKGYLHVSFVSVPVPVLAGMLMFLSLSLSSLFSWSLSLS